ncbi:MAG: DUF2807 domain-containing protein [Bacteroidota bacterium]|nr:DUF2807 domain-containing protein [Bacteroidota bacterium]
MKKIVYILAISLSSLGLFAQTSEQRNVGAFTKIDASGAAEIILTQGEPSVKVTGAENEVKNLITEVSGTTLTINTKGNIKEDIKVYVSMKTLEEINTSGAVYLKSDTTFNADKLELIASGASKIKLDVICKEIKSTVTGAATLVLTGATEVHIAHTSGASSLKAYKLSTINSNVTCSGASTAKISVNQRLNVNASGASSLKFTGNPEDKTINVSGTADVKHVDSDKTDVVLNDSDTTKITWRNKKYTLSDEDFNFNWEHDFHYWQGVELNLNGLIGANGSTSLPATAEHMSINYGVKSLGWNLNLAEKNFHIYKNYINLVTGIGFSFNSYQFKNPIRLNADSSFTSYTLDSTISFHKNKLKTSYVQIPVMLEFNTSAKSERSFHIAAGVIGGYKLNSKTLRTYEINGYEFEEKRKDDFNINPFKLDATARIGYGPFTMFATYSLTELFEPKKGTQVNPFTVGVRIVPF